MARNQARRRKPKTSKKFKLPKIRIGRFIAPLVAVAIVLGTYQASVTLLYRRISSIEISGPFQRVTALQIEEAISDEIDAGFVGADLDRIQERIIALPWIDQARVARSLNRSASTLQRQLQAEGLSYRTLLDETRRSLAEEYLRDRKHSHAQIAYLVGFSDQSNFSRAFKRWTGSSPRQFQDQQRREAGNT